jgi:hypothetical protein
VKHVWTNQIDGVWRCESCKKVHPGYYDPDSYELGECNGVPPPPLKEYLRLNAEPLFATMRDNRILRQGE